jgi:hypothetical protein
MFCNEILVSSLVLGLRLSLAIWKANGPVPPQQFLEPAIE